MRKLKAMIADDELLARKRIRRLLAEEVDIEVAGECANSRQAAEMMRRVAFDLLFLDVQMPKVDGFELLELVRNAGRPAVIFVTAFEQHALRAFEVGAIDYLLKPFEETRFRKAVQRARETLGRADGGAISERMLKLLEEAGRRDQSADVVLVRSVDKTTLVNIREIDWIESADNYVRLHVGRDSHLVRETMAVFEAKLPRSEFVRIHRSTIVNLERVLEFRPWFNGDFTVLLKTGQQLRLSRTYRDGVQDLLGHSL